MANQRVEADNPPHLSPDIEANKDEQMFQHTKAALLHSEEFKTAFGEQFFKSDTSTSSDFSEVSYIKGSNSYQAGHYFHIQPHGITQFIEISRRKADGNIDGVETNWSKELKQGRYYYFTVDESGRKIIDEDGDNFKKFLEEV